MTEFSPGFRVSPMDLGVLALGMVGAAVAASVDLSWGFVFGLPVVHFFLFCNVFRVSRSLELLWTGLFLVLAGSTVIWGAPGWLATVIVSAVATAAVVITEMRKPSYHGVGWQRINPHLREWWSANRS